MGEVWPKLPRIEATCTVMPIRAPAAKRLAFRSAQSDLPQPLVQEVRVHVHQRAGSRGNLHGVAFDDASRTTRSVASTSGRSCARLGKL